MEKQKSEKAPEFDPFANLQNAPPEGNEIDVYC